MSYDWEVTFDEKDRFAAEDSHLRLQGIEMPNKLQGGYHYRTEAAARRGARKWLKETGRSGTVKVVPAEPIPHSYILDT